tara:strand:+ start:1273 stop:1419 length:147 start_codon:yes stop_codon:yes gene_type:complete
MKKIFLIASIIIFSCNKNSDYPWFYGTFEDALQQAGEKIIFLDFYTDS